MWPDGLRERLRAGDPPALCVAFSGGPDSTALLHALAQLPEARERSLRALHVDHGLHADSAAWSERCKAFCIALGVALTVARVRVEDPHGEGIEAAARRERRAVFAREMTNGEWMVLAHHRDDQIETVLLKLLRGAGPEGLGGMRALRPFGRGFLWRPLLDIPRDALRACVAAHHLPCIEDPANSNPRFARNVLRNEIIPQIARHWPHAGTAILHSAELCRHAATHITQEAEASLPLLRREGGTLDVDAWLALPAALRAPALHQWLRERGLPAPADAQYKQLQWQAAHAVEDALPCVAWLGAEVRIWDGRLHASAPLHPPPDGSWQAVWSGTPLRLPADCGSIEPVPFTPSPQHAATARFDPPLSVRMRRGGERLRPAGDAHTRELRDLFQRARVPPWVRERCPLIYAGDELIAVADTWATERGKAIFDASGTHPRWLRPAWLHGT